MQNNIVRGIVAVLAGLVAAFVIVFLVEGLGHMLFPPPPGVDVTRSEDLARLMDVMPLAAKLFVVFAWFLGALVGGIVALSIGRRPLFAWIIGAALVALSVLTTMTFPHPLWMVIAAIVLPVLAAFLAIRLARLPAMP